MNTAIREYTVEELQALLVQHDGGVLKHGSHKGGKGREFCGMEFVAKLAGEPWTDDPQCAHPALSAYVRAMNDASWPSDQERTRVLLPLLAKVFGTRDLKISMTRIVEATIREIVPMALEAAASVAVGDDRPELLEAAKNCREAPSARAAYAAYAAADAAAADAAADAAAADAAARAAAYAAYAAADAAADAADAADAARAAARAAAYAARAADAADAADAAAYAVYAARAADAAADAADAAGAAREKSVAIVIAEIDRARADG